MKHNNAIAIITANLLRSKLGKKLNIYVPAENDEFVLIAYLKKYITVEQILDVDCDILAERDILLVYSPDGYISRGMQVEIDHARNINKLILQFDAVTNGTAKMIGELIDIIKARNDGI